MALKVSGFSSTALDYKIVYFDNQSSPTAAIQENVTGASGRWYSVDIDNKSGSSVFVKLSDGFAPTLGTTTPGWVYQVKPQPRTTRLNRSSNKWRYRHCCLLIEEYHGRNC